MYPSVRSIGAREQIRVCEAKGGAGIVSIQTVNFFIAFTFTYLPQRVDSDHYGRFDC